jgi:type IV pilus assembly protein PilM
VIVLSLGTDATDLVITNGMRVWQRSIPLGGNHFTKALTKELKLTFAKAEHLKRNAATAQDPKAVFQAMRPVFNDLLTEIQRSIGYFSSVDRAAKVERMLALGNTIKLPGLRRYLAQSLGFEVDRLAAFSGLSGAEVIGSPAFEENLSSFAVCHGLCVQGLQSAALRTNLLPKEIVKDRIIKSKKPWAVAAAAVLLLGCTLSIASHAMGVRTVDKGLFASAEQQAEEVKKAADDFKSQATTVQADIKKNETVGRNVVDSVAGRTRWLELLKAVFDSLPQDGKVQPNDVEERNRIQVTSITCSQIDKDGANTFLKYMVGKGWYVPTPEESAAAGLPSDPSAGGTGAPSPGTPAATSAAPAPAAATSGSDTAAGSGAADNPGGVWGIQLNCFHYHNSDSAMRKGNYGAEFVRNTLIKNLRDGQTMVPNGDLNKPEWVSNRDLGILYPTIVNPLKPEEVTITPGAEGDSGENWSAPVAPRAGSGSSGMMPGGPLGGMPHMPTSGPGGMGMMPGMSSPGMSSPGMSFPGSSTAARSTGGMDKEAIKVKRFSFYVQFIWQPVSPAERKKLQEARAQAQAASQNPAGQGSGTGPGANSGTLAPGPAAPAGVPSQPAPAPAVPSAPLAPAGAANPTSTKP